MKEIANFHITKHQNDIFSIYRYEKNNATCERRHFHKNYEILIVEKGSVRCIYDNKEYELVEGQSLLFHPFQVHCFHLNEGAKLFCMSFSRRFCVALDGEIKGKVAENPIFSLSKRVFHFVIDTIFNTFGNKAFMVALQNKEQEFVIKSATYAIGGEYVAKVKLDKRTRSVYTVGVEVAEFIAENFKNDISLQEVANVLNYNYQYLSRVFNKVFDTSFKKMLNVYRMEQAMMFLTETDIPISDVAFSSGFQSIRSLNAVCMETYKATPTQLRNSKEWEIALKRFENNEQ